QTRPLSDIRELTEPSLVDLASRKLATESKHPESELRRHTSLTRKGSLLSRKGSLSRAEPLSRKGSRGSSRLAPSPGIRHLTDQHRGRTSPVRSLGDGPSSIYSIPDAIVPPRSSSRTREANVVPTPQAPAIPPPPPPGIGYTIPNKGRSHSPVKEIAAKWDPITSDDVRPIPPRTFARVPSNEILEFPTHRHHRVSTDLKVGAPLFVGGGSLEGSVCVTVDDVDRTRHKRALAIARISIDLLGIEEMLNVKRAVFLNLATELIDSDHPPPPTMVESTRHLSPTDPFWLLNPSVTTMPFSLSLPLDVGPPPFNSKQARIRYLLCVTLLVRDKGTQYLVRSSQDVSVLSVYDPEKALMSLPSPLTASDEYARAKDSTLEVIRVTAGLHRQSAASTMERSASQARIFDSNDRTILARTSIKHGTGGWQGVSAHTTDTRTCDLELPRGHATVKCGKFFEVRYFLNIIASSTHTKLVSVQLPVVLIHMNSLDVVPNSVAQVAAAIEEKRLGPDSRNSRTRRQRSQHSLSRRPSTSVQGRAFAAPRMQSLDRARAEAEDLKQLGRILDHSPRRYSAADTGLVGFSYEYDYHTPPSNRKGRFMETESLESMKRRLRRARSNDTNHSRRTEGTQRTIANNHNSNENRQGSLSALGFRDAEIGEDLELSGLGAQGGSTAASFKARLEAARDRQFRFQSKKPREGWKAKGLDWLMGDKEEREKE
ncbi:hypothetical protein K490DRAFT_12751, partial [Saccharata proteae CBS 121410]